MQRLKLFLTRGGDRAITGAEGGTLGSVPGQLIARGSGRQIERSFAPAADKREHENAHHQNANGMHHEALVEATKPTRICPPPLLAIQSGPDPRRSICGPGALGPGRALPVRSSLELIFIPFPRASFSIGEKQQRSRPRGFKPWTAVGE